MEIKNKRKKNPLYAVTNSGKDVEEAANLLELMILKFQLRPLIDFIKTIFEILLSSVKSSAQLETVQQFLEKIINLTSLFSKAT
jgi:hypothetical protein